MARLTLRLLGELQVDRQDRGDTASAGRKAQALLAYLALNPRQRCSRERLATLLWSDRGEEQARHSLRQSVLALRKALNDESGTILISDGERLALDLEKADIDVRRFEQFAAASSRESLEQASVLYRGDFLEGIDVRSEGFDEWCAAERMRLRDLAIDAQRRLTQICIDAGDWDAAQSAAQRLLALDPTQETGHQFLMRIYDRTGRRSMALRQYRTCEEILKRELDAQPSPEISRLYAEIRERSEAPASAVVADTPSQISAPPPPAAGASLAGAGRPRSRGWLRGRSAVGFWLLCAVVVALAGLGAVELAGLLTRERADPAKMQFPLPEKPSIAVMPFESLGADGTQDGFGDGLSTEITNTLSIISEMFVIDHYSTTAFRSQRLPARKVAEQLGVRYVLEGAIQRSGDRVRISATLVDAVAGNNVWADRYEREVTNLFALEDEITLAIVTALQVRITEGEQERVASMHGSRNFEAWVLAGHALQLLRHLTKGDVARSRELYRQVSVLDPNYPGAWDGLAWTYLIDARFGWSASPSDDLAMAGDLVQKALALDPERPRTFALLGTLSLIKGDHAQAVTFGEKAMALDPNGAEDAALLAFTFTYSGEPEKSIALIGRAMRLSPFYPDWFRWVLGRANRLAGRLHEAENALAVSRSETDSLQRLVELAATYSEMGRLQEARSIATEIVKIDPKFSILVWTKTPPNRDPAATQREVDILRRAGLPE